MWRIGTTWRIDIVLLVLLSLAGATAARGADEVSFVNIADDPDSGLVFSKHPSSLFATTTQVRQDSLQNPIDFVTRVLTLPAMGGFGLSGAAVWDYDRDGDLDIYVANGPGAPNSLFSNQLQETGSLHFIDVAVSAGVDATAQDSQGVCYGDIDNDGDPDLVVLGRKEPNLLFENRGDGTFHVVQESGIEAQDRTSTSCAMGDVDGDGLLDIVVANSFDLVNHVPIFFEAFSLNEHNQLFRNNGDNTFTDISLASGITDTVFSDPTDNGQPTISWAVSMVDIDLDGDLDIIFADDQAAYPEGDETFPFPPFDPGTDRGFLHVFLNDGTGTFIDRPILDTPNDTGAYMGLGFGDFDSDGHMDVFATNFGDYAITLGDPDPPILGFQASRWFLGSGGGDFTDPGVGNDIIATPFGWSTAVFDYDNDGDQDILFHGGIDLMAQVSLDNPGAIFQNQGDATFSADLDAVTTDHSRRCVRALAVGDLDRNGFVDIVTPSEMNVAENITLEPNIVQFGGPYDSVAKFARFWAENPAGLDQWTGAENELGDLVVELNSGNDNHWVSATPVGSAGLTAGGRVNRDGIGAVIFFKPHRGEQVMSPVTGGAGYLSQSSRERIFGLGDDRFGRLEVLWPGGTRNRLYGVRRGERLTIPEIPCSFDSNLSFRAYLVCVLRSLRDLETNGVVERAMSLRLLESAIIAFFDR